MKRLLVLAVIALLTLGLLGTAGCSKKVSREANVAAGEYYSDEDYAKLSKEEAAAYCADLAAELERLQRETAGLDTGDEQETAKLRADLARLQSRFDSQHDHVSQLEEEIDYFKSLPSSYTVINGDFLYKISGKEEIYADPIKWPRIYRANRDQIADPNLIYPEQVLAIPRDWPTRHTVVTGEWLSKIAGYWEVYDNYREWTRLYEANKGEISDPDLIYPDQVLDIPR